MRHLLMTGGDVRRSQQTGDSRTAELKTITFPSISFMTVDHTPGGGVGTVSYTMPRIEAPEPKFAVMGIDETIFSDLGSAAEWTFAGAYKNVQTGDILPARAIFRGAVSTWEPDEYSPTEAQGCTHTLKEVTHFAFEVEKKELWYWDFYANVLRTNGVDQYAKINAALGV